MSLILSVKFVIGIVKRLGSDAYYRSLGFVTLLVLVIGTLFTWLVGKWPFAEAVFYAVTTMSMNTPYGSRAFASGAEMMYFHMGYTFLSVGVFIIFTLETAKTMHATYQNVINKMDERKAKKARA